MKSLDQDFNFLLLKCPLELVTVHTTVKIQKHPSVEELPLHSAKKEIESRRETGRTAIARALRIYANFPKTLWLEGLGCLCFSISTRLTKISSLLNYPDCFC